MVGFFGHHSSRGGQYEETENNLDEIAFHFAPSRVLLLTAVRLLESTCEKDNGGGAWRQLTLGPPSGGEIGLSNGGLVASIVSC
jgi:hypothetical protein